jgi:ADP-ribose pyrophosphatase YjhB (NUDIX family)
MSKRYNIRVYALIIHEGKLLITDEQRGAAKMTKFPGGGLEWGEGIADCLRRECMEEMQQEPLSWDHFYTTDFFMQSAFRADDQLISIYYKANLPAPEKIPASEIPFEHTRDEEGAQTFRWVTLDTLNADDLTYPIDRHVVRLLQLNRN